MRFVCRFLLAASLATLCAGARAQLQSPNVYTSIVSTRVFSGSSTVTGTECFQPIDKYGSPIALTVAGGGYYEKGSNFCEPLTGGALNVNGSLELPDSQTDSAPGHGYNLTIYNNLTGEASTPVAIYGITGPSWSLDTYTPAASVPTTSAFTFTMSASAPTGACTVPSLDTAKDTSVLYVCGADKQWHASASAGGAVSAVTAEGACAAATLVNGILNVPFCPPGSGGGAAGTYYANSYVDHNAQGAARSGIYNAITGPLANGSSTLANGAVLTIDPAYSGNGDEVNNLGSGFPGLGVQPLNGNLMPYGLAAYDYRNGAFAALMRDPGVSYETQTPVGFAQATAYTQNTNLGGVGGQLWSTGSSLPGLDLGGNPGPQPSYEFTVQAEANHFVTNSAGIVDVQDFAGNIFNGNGDINGPGNTYLTVKTGAASGSSEGFTGRHFYPTEGANSTGTVTSAQGATALTLTCTSSDCTTVTPMTELLDTTHDVLSNTITFTPASNSAVLGTLGTPISSSLVSTPATITNALTVAANPNGVGATITFNVGSGAALAPSELCQSIDYPSTLSEVFEVTAVGILTGGQQSITAYLYHQHAAGTNILCGGMVGRVMELTADTYNGLIYPWQILGATSTTTLLLGTPGWSAYAQLGSSGPIRIYHAAKIVDPRDPANGLAIDGRGFSVQANDAFLPGDSVVNTGYPIQAWTGDKMFPIFNDPYGSFSAHADAYQGRAFNGNSNIWDEVNGNPNSWYAGAGGTMSAPDVMGNLQGMWGVGFNMQEPLQQAFINIYSWDIPQSFFNLYQYNGQVLQFNKSGNLHWNGSLSVDGLVNGVALTNTGPATNCLSQAGSYVACGSGGGGGGAVSSLTTNGGSGAATLVGGVLNIPQYSGGGSGMVYPGVGIGNSSGSAWGTSYGPGNPIPANFLASIPYSQLSGTVPTWNQNTTGTAANLSGTPALPSGTTAAPMSPFDNSLAVATDQFVQGRVVTAVATANGFLGSIAGGVVTVNVDPSHELPTNTGSPSTYLNGAGTYTIPAGGGGSMVYPSAGIGNSSGSAWGTSYGPGNPIPANFLATIPYSQLSGAPGPGTLAAQSANSVAITGGTVDATTIGATTPAPATVTTLAAQQLNVSNPAAPGGSVVRAGSALCPNVTAGATTYAASMCYFNIGQSESLNNDGGLEFHYFGDGSTSNSIRMQFYNTNFLAAIVNQSWFATGHTSIGSETDSGKDLAVGSAQAFTVDDAGNVNASSIALPGAISTRPAMFNWMQALSNCKSQAVNMTVFGDSQVVVDNVIASSEPTLPNPAQRYIDMIRQYGQITCPSHGTGLQAVVAVTNTGTTTPGINADFWSSNVALSVDTSGAFGPYQNGTGNYGVIDAASGTVLTFTSSIPWDHFNTYCEAGTGTNAWTIAVDGTNVASCGGGSFTKAPSVIVSPDVTGSTAVHVATLTCTTGPCYLFGGEGANGTVGFSVSNLGTGSAAAEWDGTNPSTQLAFSDLIPGGQALAVVEFIANEPGIGYSTTSFQSAMTAIATHEQSLSSPPSVLFISPMQDGIAGQAPYYPIIQTVAQTSNSDFIDFRNEAGQTQVSGLYAADTYHANAKGNAEEYSMLWPKLFRAPLPAPGYGTPTITAGPYNASFPGTEPGWPLNDSIFLLGVSPSGAVAANTQFATVNFGKRWKNASGTSDQNPVCTFGNFNGPAASAPIFTYGVNPATVTFASPVALSAQSYIWIVHCYAESEQ